VQVLVLVAARRLARRVERLVDRVDRELAPVFGHVNAIARDASHAAALATAQIERADRLFADLARKIDQTITLVQDNIMAPAREGKALLNALRAAVDALRNARRNRPRHRSEEEDALFI
jgi:hypothetical protein